MKRTLLMESVLGQTRLAVIEDGELCALYCERPDDGNLTGNIYLGRVMNVLPGMNAAFVDIGIGKNAFLPAADAQRGPEDSPHIEDILKPGQELVVQVSKAAAGDKGPRVGAEVSLPGRLLALVPGKGRAWVSKKIADEAERARLRDAVAPLVDGSGHGVIVRTAAAGADLGALAAEFDALRALWEEIRTRAAHAAAPRRLYSDESLARTAVRDLLDDDVDALWTDNPGAYGTLRQFAGIFAPGWLDRIRLHRGSVPLFDLYSVDDRLDRALGKRVWLKSGGFLFVEETEALTVVDVNTGKYTGRKDLEETIFRLNCEAAREVMRQLKLRDIGGIVVVDFIDMASAEHREALLALLREYAALDRNRTTVAGITNLGLVEITRKRARQSLSGQLLHACDACGGSGKVWSHETLARRIAREIWRRRWMGEDNPVLVAARRPVAEWLFTIGAPAGGDVYAYADDRLEPGTYDIRPADPEALPPGAQRLKRGK